MCYKSNISAAVPQSKIELKEGVEVRCVKGKTVGVRLKYDHWYSVCKDEKGFYIERNGPVGLYICGTPWDAYFDLTNPRWPEKMEKDNGGWIDVKDRLPELDIMVLAHCSSINSWVVVMRVASYDGLGYKFITPWNSDTVKTVTHWQPLPTPPNYLTSK